MTKATAATLGIWALALASAGALAYTLARALAPASQPAVASAQLPAKEAAPAPTAEDAPVMTLRPLVITAKPRASPRAALTALPRRWRDLSEVRCGDWQPLATGPVDRSVRYCE
jgi:hypothetical protein